MNFPVQISDIHISIFRQEDRISDLEKFVATTLDTIKPPVTLASGDLTDAKDRDLLGSRQYEKEWQIYNDVLTKANVMNKTLWLDLRGNHGKKSNFFNKFDFHTVFDKSSIAILQIILMCHQV